MNNSMLKLIIVTTLSIICLNSTAQTVSQKDYCKEFFTTNATHDISSIYSMGEKEFYKKGECSLRVNTDDGTLTIWDEDGGHTFPITNQITGIPVKKGKDPLFAYPIDPSKALEMQAPQGIFYITAEQGKKSAIVTMFVWAKNKKIDLMKMEMF